LFIGKLAKMAAGFALYGGPQVDMKSCSMKIVIIIVKIAKKRLFAYTQDKHRHNRLLEKNTTSKLQLPPSAFPETNTQETTVSATTT